MNICSQNQFPERGRVLGQLANLWNKYRHKRVCSISLRAHYLASVTSAATITGASAPPGAASP
ncbi:MAG TPA: hypothetical protein P5286_11600, partial [Treponemataceae bacterium]|nr:hypothetical protein [Treponemataceae bacterium]